ncbi:MAG TPA: hypothetical protein VM305_00785, partial [Candidatus Limnocylindrales bacterium]|nr:hypothetical protein [Candidatus Limnocylindrales bacterium]
MDSRTTQRMAALALLTFIFAAAAFMPAADAAHAGPDHACPFCATRPQPIAAMPQPEAYPTPAATQAATAVTLGATTVRLRAAVYQVYRFGARGKLLEQRTVRFASPRVWRAPAEEVTLGTGRYVKLASGPYSGWYVPAASTVSAATTHFTPHLNVTLRSGPLVARRFFGPVVTRRIATLATTATFKSSKRALFNGATHYLIETGPLAGRWVAASRIIVPSATDSQKATPTPAASPTA